MNKRVILNYLKCKESNEQLDSLINECILEVKKIALFRVKYKQFNIKHSPLCIEELDLYFDSKDLDYYLENCDQCLIIGCTLGIEIDKRIKYYEHLDISKALVFDAVSNAYLEELCNKYEKDLNLGIHTYRFAAGYGDIPLTLNKQFYKVLELYKIGMNMNDVGLLVPMKSMIGIIGIGTTSKKTCLSCIRKENCELRKEGQRCYVID